MVDFKDRLIAAVRVLHEIATAFGEGLAMTNTAIILLGECLLSALNDALLKTYFKSLFSV